MRNSLRRNRIILQERGGAVDALNQPVPDDWVDFARDVWADIRYLNGLETVKSDAAVAVTRASLRILYRPGVVANMRALEGTVVYDIKSVLPVKSALDPTGRRLLDLVAETGLSNG